ncbi:hypothetical protein TA3x_000965 [Tundrisphaera sp. TA3]|uniref:hypothetical protein n=1 Tax=Tundrisphaera sp. TA3 TaxID=3435775 RepID=UPI003EBCD74F
MKQKQAWFRRSMRVPVMLTLSLLVGGSGCGDGTVRGAGSIDLPESSLKKFPTSKPAPRGARTSPSVVRPG